MGGSKCKKKRGFSLLPSIILSWARANVEGAGFTVEDEDGEDQEKEDFDESYHRKWKAQAKLAIKNPDRELKIYTWGRALIKKQPAYFECNFNAAVLNGRGGGVDLKNNNGLSPDIQRNVGR